MEGAPGSEWRRVQPGVPVEPGVTVGCSIRLRWVVDRAEWFGLDGVGVTGGAGPFEPAGFGLALHLVISTHIMGSPARRLSNPITRCWAQPHHRYAGTDDGPGTDQTSTQSDLR